MTMNSSAIPATQMLATSVGRIDNVRHRTDRLRANVIVVNCKIHIVMELVTTESIIHCVRRTARPHVFCSMANRIFVGQPWMLIMM